MQANKWMVYGLMGGLLLGLSTMSNAADNKKVPAKVLTTQPVKASQVAQEALSSVQPEGKVDIVNRPVIAGLWAMTIPGIHCTEYYNFLENGNFVVKSAEEWSAGIYGYQLAEQGDTTPPIIALRIQYDNLKKDCSGNVSDQRGEEFQHYVKWLTESNIAFCDAADGKKCFATLKKILP